MGGSLKTLLSFSLLGLVRISGSSSLFSAIAVFLRLPTNVLKALRLLRKSRKSQKSSLLSKETVNKGESQK